MSKEIAQAVKANRRLLGLVDDQLACLAKTTPSVALDALDADRRMPYWYVATSPTPQESASPLAGYTQQNANQSPFIRITQAFAPGQPVQTPNVGYIRVQSDAAFVATSILLSYSRDRPGGGGLGVYTGGTFHPGTFSYAGVRLYDESSNRWITLTNQNQRIQQDATLPAPSLSPSALLLEDGIRIPTECTFPRNALVRVEIYYYAALVPNDVVNVYFALGGYKVFGG